jgi:Cu-Zn family superoxide dismutase
MKFWLLGTALAFAFAGPALAQQKGGNGQAATAKASFINTKGEQIGVADLKQTPNGVLIKAEIRGLAPGGHAFHIHETGECEAGNQFKSAGGHFAPRGKKHGYETTGGPHAGDMPNQFVSQDGLLKLNVVNTNVKLGSGDGSLLDRDGSALVIHSGTDDYRSQPAGDAGDRVACAVVTQQ